MLQTSMEGNVSSSSSDDGQPLTGAEQGINDSSLSPLLKHQLNRFANTRLV